MAIKSDLLKIFENNKGEFISGQELADSLNVTRTSIWKAVKTLRSSGYPIIAATNKGYMLEEKSNILSAEAILSNLASSFDEEKIILMQSTDSTNEEAKRLLLKGLKYGTVVLSEEQTAGKGRMGRKFCSPAGDSLYMSFILEPLLDVNNSLLVTVAASVAVARSIKKIGEINLKSFAPEIKWVNDVYLRGKKVCGILTEATTDVESGQIQSLILGIGININIDPRDFPEDIRNQIDSVKITPGQRNLFVAILIDEVFGIQNEIKNFKSLGQQEPDFMDEYRRMSIVLGKEIIVIKGDEKTEATAIGINHRGGLIVKYEDGREETLNTGEISIRINE